MQSSLFCNISRRDARSNVEWAPLLRTLLPSYCVTNKAVDNFFANCITFHTSTSKSVYVITLTIEPRTPNIFWEHSPVSLLQTSFSCSFLYSIFVINHSNIGVQLRRVTQKGPPILNTNGGITHRFRQKCSHVMWVTQPSPAHAKVPSYFYSFVPSSMSIQFIICWWLKS